MASVCVISATTAFSEEVSLGSILPYGIYSGGNIFSYSISSEESADVRRKQQNRSERTQNPENVIEDALSSFGVSNDGPFRLGRVGSGAGLIYRRTSPYNGAQTQCGLNSDTLNCRWSFRF